RRVGPAGVPVGVLRGRRRVRRRGHGIHGPFQWACCVVGGVCAVGVMGYTGLLLSDMVSIDFWHTPWLIALFVVSSLSCGVAAIVTLDAALAPPSYDVSAALWRAGAALGRHRSVRARGLPVVRRVRRPVACGRGARASSKRACSRPSC
ncbi:NrfD/PsrC family molybdoenzyme membrane anchor subunit, partial [Eggerthella sinensis]|uniref:NrfD/PsrC family molybdoenzyme membrane anchor subunit n=1 Tax=Eggerthella sinensis TaxID=242230 RepID=UPI0022E7E985